MAPRDFVKVEHLPSGLTVRSDLHTAQIRNARECMRMLRGMVWSLERGAETAAATDAQRAIAQRILQER